MLKEVLPGDRLLPERDLARLFNVSRLAMREAIKALEQRGLIESRRGAGGGTFVLSLTGRALRLSRAQLKRQWVELQKMLEYRLVIEPEAARLAARRITPEALDQLRSFVERSQGDCPREAFRATDIRFHLLISQVAQNPFIEEAVRRIRVKLSPGLDLMPYNDAVQRRTCEEHAALITCLQAGDETGAARLMLEHIRGTEEALSRLLGS